MTLKIYLGIVGSKKVQAFAKKHNCGWCLTPDNARPVPHGTYILDNGAFSAYLHGENYSPKRFLKLLEKYPDYDFAVAPDIVCGGMKSLEFSLTFVKERIDQRFYLAVQDGMQGTPVEQNLDKFDGIFIGGRSNGSFQQPRCGQISRISTD